MMEKPLLPPPETPANCSLAFADVHTWCIHIVQVSLAALSLTLNCVVVLFIHRAAPIPYAQRRQLAAVSINFSLISGLQLSRNVFLLFSLYRPCMHLTNTAACKLQAFPLFFCYIHAGFLISILAVRINEKYKESRRPIPYEWLCSAWQAVVAALTVGVTLLFTAFDGDDGILAMKQCSPLLALRETERSFYLLTLLIALHAFAVLSISICVEPNPAFFDRRTVFSHSVRDVVTVETLLWQLSFLASGALILYRFMLKAPCYECVRVGLELSFICLPLLNAFIHPILLIWWVYPVRDAGVRVFPSLAAVLPEYVLVAPPPVRRRSSRLRRIRSPRFSSTANHNIAKTLFEVIPSSAAVMNDAKNPDQPSTSSNCAAANHNTKRNKPDSKEHKSPVADGV